jgi:hypothetical protein
MLTLLGVVGVKVQQVICKICNVVKVGFTTGYLIIIGVLRTQVTQFVVRQRNRLVQILQKLEVLLVDCRIIAELSIRTGLIVVIRKAGQIGTHLQTIVLKTLQRAKQVLKIDK